MIAVDTNVLVRVITNDNTDQARLAMRLLSRQNSVFVSKTVVLEVEWVLRSAYKIASPFILKALVEFLDRSNVEVEDETAVRSAFDWFRQGMDFADALHLASASGERDFFTFDNAMLRKGRELGLRVSAPI
jgi:predicted nucleic-acid-binding protein